MTVIHSQWWLFFPALSNSVGKGLGLGFWCTAGGKKESLGKQYQSQDAVWSRGAGWGLKDLGWEVCLRHSLAWDRLNHLAALTSLSRGLGLRSWGCTWQTQTQARVLMPKGQTMRFLFPPVYLHFGSATP